MHNVIYSGIKLLNDYLTDSHFWSKAGIKISVIHGDRDLVISIMMNEHQQHQDGSSILKVLIFLGMLAGHYYILGREKQFSRYLEHIWASLAVLPALRNCYIKYLNSPFLNSLSFN